MPRPAWFAVVVLIALTIVAVAWRDGEPALTPSGVGTGERDAPAAAASAGTESMTGDHTSEAQRELVGEVGQPKPANATVLRIRLRGLVPAAPWTKPLRFDLEGRDAATREGFEFERRLEVADDGTASTALPAWLPAAANVKLRIGADDDNYRPLAYRSRSRPDASTELVLDVQAVAVLEGRVVDRRRDPVSPARITAFVLQNGNPIGAAVGSTSTSHEGRYHVQVPSGVPLLLVATPMQPLLLSGLRLTGRHGAVADLGIANPDLLPSACEVDGIFGAPTTVPDLVLADAATIRGVVQWPDGTPIAKAKIGTQGAGRNATGLIPQMVEVSPNTAIARSSDGRVVLHATDWTDERGEFALPAARGDRLDLVVASIPDVLFLADVRVTADPAPTRVTVEAPAPVRLHVTEAGQPVRRATIHFGGLSGQCDDDGALEVVTTRAAIARASHGSRRSQSVTVTPSQSGNVIELPLVEALTKVAIELSGAYRVRNASFRHWNERLQNGHSILHRGDSSGPFELFLAPGHYRLRVEAAPGERNGTFLLPIHHEFDVGTAPLRLDLPARFGGHLTVHVTDAQGKHVGGSCRVLDRDGAAVRGEFVALQPGGTARIGDTGELLPNGPNRFAPVLPPGDYDLELTLPNGTQRSRATIRPREVTIARIRLP